MTKKKIASLLLSSVLMISLFAAGSSETKNTISVMGNGSVIVDSDIAHIRVSVLTTDADASLSAQKNADLMTRVQDALIKIGLTKADFATSNYSIYENKPYNSKDGSYGPPEYCTSNNLSVTVKDVSKTGLVIDTALKAGANQLSSLSFSSSKIAEAYDEARIQAIKDAQKKAEVLAREAGRKLGKAIIIEESHSYAEPIAYTGAMMMKEARADTPIVAEDSTATYAVRVVFELK